VANGWQDMAIFFENNVHLLRFAASYCVGFVPFIIMFHLMRVCWTTIPYLASAGDISLRSCQADTFSIKSIAITSSGKQEVHKTSIE